MPVKHKFQSAKADGSDNTLVKPSNWNDIHTVTLGTVRTSVSYSALATDEVILATAGASDITISLPDATTCQGAALYIKKVDGGVGGVLIATVNSQLVDGDASYYLANQWQYVKLMSDGMNWFVIGNN